MSSEHVPAKHPWANWFEFDIQPLLVITRSERFIRFLPYVIVPLLLLVYLLAVSRSLNRLPRSLPWMDRRPGELFSAFRACLRQYGAGFDGLREASEEASGDILFNLPFTNFSTVWKTWAFIRVSTTELQTCCDSPNGASEMAVEAA
jgi:hypothetical protein